MKQNTFLVTILCCIICIYPKDINAQKRDMRALWVVSLLNLDFPSSKNLSVEQQKQEFINILDSMQQYNFNTIVMQIRPSGDTLYPSNYEPWSAVLTGTQGKPPRPYYDPLDFMIRESHKRNIDFHAWLNPYRAILNYKNTKVSDNHPINHYPEWFVNYGKHTYYNPGIPEVRNFIVKVVTDIVCNYDIDAIHMDDYFYPYKIANKKFPDEKTFHKYPNGFSKMNKDEWRRNNVNIIIKKIHYAIKNTKPWLQFGISPFGVWRNADKDPRGSNTKTKQTNYDSLYSDILLWIKKKHIDYVVPQIYWHIGNPFADYKTLVKWWSDNCDNTTLYIGHALYKMGSNNKYKAWKKGNEITRQMSYNQQYANIKGSMFFRYSNFIDEPLQGLKDSLKNNFYHYPALTIPTKGLFTKDIVPTAKLEKINRNKFLLIWDAPKGKGADDLKYFLVYMFEGKRKIGDLNDPRSIICITKEQQLVLHKNTRKYRRKRTFVITRVNKAGHESSISNMIYKKL